MILPVYRLTLRALLLQRRTIMLAAVVLAPVATSLIYALARPGGSDTVDFYSGIVQKLFVPAVAALVALVFGVIGAIKLAFWVLLIALLVAVVAGFLGRSLFTTR